MTLDKIIRGELNRYISAYVFAQDDNGRKTVYDSMQYYLRNHNLTRFEEHAYLRIWEDNLLIMKAKMRGRYY